MANTLKMLTSACLCTVHIELKRVRASSIRGSKNKSHTSRWKHTSTKVRFARACPIVQIKIRKSSCHSVSQKGEGKTVRIIKGPHVAC